MRRKPDFGGVRGARLLAAAVLVAGGLGCGRVLEPPPVGPARWIDQVPTEFLTEDRLVTPSVVRDWQPGGGTSAASSSLDRWSAVSSNAEQRVTAEGLVLSTSEPLLLLERDLGLDAAEIDAVRVTLRGVRRNIRLQWRPGGAPFARGGALVASTKDGEVMPTGHRRITFALRTAPAWSGPIGGLRLVIPVESGQPVVVTRIEAMSYASSAELLAAASGRPWKVDVDHEVRDVRLGIPGLPLTWSGSGQSAGALRFGYALTGRPRTGFEFRVTSRSGVDGERLVWSDRLDPGVDPAGVGVWHDGEVELPAGDRELVFEVVTDEPHDPVDGWSVWSSPVVVSPNRGGDRPSVLLIVIDTLRADRLSLYGYSRSTSPSLDAWAAGHAVVFDNAVAQSPWTLPSHSSLFTGLNVTRHGVSHTDSTALARLETMAGRFRDAGYHTLAVTGGGYVHPRYGFSNGFDRYRYWAAEDAPAESEFPAGIDHALRQLRAAPGPVFLFLHTFAVHGPYRCREPFFGSLTPELAPPPGLVNPTDTGFVLEPPDGSDPVPFGDDRLASAMYDSGVAHVDAELRRLFDELRADGMLERSIVVFTSDHGEGLGEQGVTGHGYLKENNVLVPLVMAFPDQLGAGSRVPTQVRLIDLLPTLLEATGLPPAVGIDGSSLLPLVRDREARHPDTAMTYAIARKGGVGLRVANRLKYTFNNSALEPLRGREALFDLTVDPAETGDRLADHPEASGLRAELRELLGEHSGLWMRFANPGAQPVEARIRGTLVHPEGVKSPDLGCPCVSLERKDELRVTVPAGERFTLVFERVVAGDVEVELASPAAAGGRAFRHRFDPATIEAGLSYTADGGQWRVGARDDDSGSVVEVFWHGLEAARVVEAPSVVDETLVEQLRALGYAE